MALYDEKIVRDKSGAIRIPESIKLNEKQTKKLADDLFMATKKNIGVTQLDMSFYEFDRFKPNRPKKKGGEKWDDAQKRFVLEHSGEDFGEIADLLNEKFGTSRQYMSIKHKYAELVSQLADWKKDNDEIVGKTDKEILDLFFDAEEEQ